MYNSLVNALKATSIPFAEYAWDTRPSTDYGVVSIDLEASALTADDQKVCRAHEGSVDLYAHSYRGDAIEDIERILEQICGGAWALNSIQYEEDTRLLHYEWVFQLEMI